MLKNARALESSMVIAAISAFAVAATSAAPAFATGSSGLVSTASGLLAKGYEAAPALMLGLVFSIVLSVITLFTIAVRPIAFPAKSEWRRKGEALVAEQPAEWQGNADAVTGAPQPFLEFDGVRGGRCALLSDMLRIGRDDDNDIRIAALSVQRHHAAIHREDYDDWHITALADGSSVVVNGKRCSEALLHDGDIIQLGPGRMRFRAGYA